MKKLLFAIAMLMVSWAFIPASTPAMAIETSPLGAISKTVPATNLTHVHCCRHHHHRRHYYVYRRCCRFYVYKRYYRHHHRHLYCYQHRRHYHCYWL